MSHSWWWSWTGKEEEDCFLATCRMTSQKITDIRPLGVHFKQSCCNYISQCWNKFSSTQTCTGCTYCDLCEVTGEIDKVDKIVAIHNQRLAVGQVGVTELSPLQWGESGRFHTRQGAVHTCLVGEAVTHTWEHTDRFNCRQEANTYLSW